MGWHFWYTSSSPPTKITSCPCSACSVLRETGASSPETPVSRPASCSRRDVSGLTVLMSTTVAPARAPARTPSGPYITCSSAASFVTLENTMSTPAASCLDVAATFAPRCCKGSVLSWVRSYTTTSWWAASNRPAMRLPIAPTPIKPTRIVSPQPLWILVCPIEMMGRLVELVLSVACGERGPAEQRCHGSLAQRAKTAGGVQCLLEHRERVTARDHDARRQVHGIVEAFDGHHGAAHQDERIAHGLHPQHSDVLLDEPGHDLLLEAVVMRVHHIQRHLHRVEPEPVRPRGVEHPQMDGGALVTGEADVADLTRALRRHHGLQRAIRAEHTLRIRHPDHLVELHEVDAVGLQPAERLVDLLRRGVLVATIDLGHEKHLVAIAVAQRLSHAELARPTVVVPAVVEEVDSVVDGRANDADGFLLVSLPAEVVAAHTDQGHHLSGPPKATVRNPVAGSHYRHAHRFRMPCASRRAAPATQGKSLRRRAFSGATVTRGRAAPAWWGADG